MKAYKTYEDLGQEPPSFSGVKQSKETPVEVISISESDVDNYSEYTIVTDAEFKSLISSLREDSYNKACRSSKSDESLLGSVRARIQHAPNIISQISIKMDETLTLPTKAQFKNKYLEILSILSGGGYKDAKYEIDLLIVDENTPADAMVVLNYAAQILESEIAKYYA